MLAEVGVTLQVIQGEGRNSRTTPARVNVTLQDAKRPAATRHSRPTQASRFILLPLPCLPWWVSTAPCAASEIVSSMLQASPCRHSHVHTGRCRYSQVPQGWSVGPAHREFWGPAHPNRLRGCLGTTQLPQRRTACRQDEIHLTTPGPAVSCGHGKLHYLPLCHVRMGGLQQMMMVCKPAICPIPDASDAQGR